MTQTSKPANLSKPKSTCILKYEVGGGAIRRLIITHTLPYMETDK